MSFNSTKCKILRITRSPNPLLYYYSMGSGTVDSVNNYSDLGFEVSHKLKWNNHIDIITKKGNRSLGFVKRTCGFRAPIAAKKLLYLSLVRSKLDYGVPVWSAHRKRNLVKLEGVQRRATRYILCSDDDYKSRLVSLKLLPLSLRRELIDLNFLIKCRLGLYDIDLTRYLTTYNPPQRTRQGSKGPLYNASKFRTESFASSYFNRIIPLWNNLPVEPRLSSSVSSFKRLTFAFYYDYFLSTFKTQDTCSWVSACRCANCRPA